jgi:hypothetical protein
MSAYHGKGGVVYMSTSGSGTATNVVYLTEYTIDFATDKVEVTSFGDTNKTYVQGLKDVKGTLSGYFDNATDQLFDAADSADGVKLYLYPTSLVPTVYFAGPAWLDASISVGVDRAVTISGNFSANGSWTRRP